MQPAPQQTVRKAVPNSVDHRRNFRERQAAGRVDTNPPSGMSVPQPVRRPVAPPVPGQRMTLAQQMGMAQQRRAQTGTVEITGHAVADPRQAMSQIPPEDQQPHQVVSPDPQQPQQVVPQTVPPHTPPNPVQTSPGAPAGNPPGPPPGTPPGPTGPQGEQGEPGEPDPLA